MEALVASALRHVGCFGADLVHVGTRLKPQSVCAGTSVLAMKCVKDRGIRRRTFSGPVKSSCVTLGKIMKSILKSDMLNFIGE